MLSPDEVSEAPVQVHGGGGAAEHGEDAFQVQKLQLLAVTVEAQRRPHIKAGKKERGGIGAEPGQTSGITRGDARSVGVVGRALSLALKS